MENENKNNHGWCCGCGSKGGLGFGILLLVIGGYFLAQDLGWISSSISFWSLVLVAFGLYFTAKSFR